MRTVNLIFALPLFLALGCSQTPADLAPLPSQEEHRTDGVSIGNGNYLQMEANLAEAVSLTSNIVTDAKKQKKQLLKITAAKKIVSVLSGEHELYSYKLTPTHIIAHVSIFENGEKCSLIAIPKVAGKSKVLCLNRQHLHCDEQNKLKGGYDVRGSDVYFAYYEPADPTGYCGMHSTAGERSATYSELRHWDGKSEKVETLFHTDPQPTLYAQLFVTDVFASLDNGNLCIDTHNNGDYNLLCRKQETKLWEKVKGVRNSSENDPYLKLGNVLLSSANENGYGEGAKLDLSTLEVTKRTGTLPTHVHFPLENGGFIGRTLWASGGIHCVGPDGNSKKVWETDLEYIRPIRVLNHAWYYGRESLRRISLDACELDPVDYFDRTRLLRLASLSWAVDDLLRVDGTAPTGLPGSAFLNADGELFSSVESTIALEHPIDLKW